MKLDQSIVAITEASGLIGRAVALHFVSLGANVILIDKRSPEFNVTLNACRSISDNCQSYLLESPTSENIESMFETIRQEHGCIDVLVNCWHSASLPSLFDRDGVDSYCDTMGGVVKKLFMFGNVAASQMARFGKAGVIINLADNLRVAELQLPTGTRALISGITRSWSQELARYNIRVGGIVPTSSDIGTADTSLNELLSQLQYEMVRNAEYIIRNDTFNGRLLEAETAI